MTAPDSIPVQKPKVSEELALRRHQGRILTLQILFEVDVTQHPIDEVLPRSLDEQEATSQISTHVTRLVNGVLAQVDEIDARIAVAAPAFPVDQLPAVDRNVLRMATYELMEGTVPPKAAINEAVEIAKRFGGPNASRFVNGSLRTILLGIERDRAAAISEEPAESGR